MIGYLAGTVLHKTDRTLILNVNGLGYRVFTPTPLLMKAEEHLPLELHIHTHVREDELTLFGFATLKDLALFERLISVSGVGPKLAMDLFSRPTEQIKKAILEKDVARLTQIPGIGKKTAERLILELRDKLASEGIEPGTAPLPSGESHVPDEVLHALLGLGYRRNDIDRVFRSLTEPIQESESMIKYFLKNV